MRFDSIPKFDSYWVVKDRFMAGEYPYPYTGEAGKDDDILCWLTSNGFTCFLDLTEFGEYRTKDYAPLLKPLAGDKMVIHHRISIPDMETPSIDSMIRILDTIEDAISQEQRVYLHCYAGVGRTGTVVGCYLVRQGMDGEAALAYIKEQRSIALSGWTRSPETQAQRQMVLNWVE